MGVPRLTLKERLALLLLRGAGAETGVLPNELQVRVATEAALEAAINLATIQRVLLHSIFRELEENGIFIGISESVSSEMERNVDTLRASQIVVGEIAGLIKPLRDDK